MSKFFLLMSLLFSLPSFKPAEIPICPTCLHCGGKGKIVHECPPPRRIWVECDGPREETCSWCKGTGSYCPPPAPIKPPPPPPDQCTRCKGSGLVYKMCKFCEEPIEIKCSKCGGDGKI